MASMINRVYNTIRNLFQKHNRGMITPDEFNDACKYVQNKLIRETFDYENNLSTLKRGFRSPQVNDEREKYYMDIKKTLTKDSKLTYYIDENRFRLPDDYSLIQSIYYKGIYVEEIDSYERSVLINNDITPSELYPVYMMHSFNVEVIPDSIMKDIVMYYYRSAKDPKFTYRKIGNSVVFDESISGYQDFELSDKLFDLIIVELALYFGIQLKMADVAQIISNEDIKNEQIKNK